MAFLALWTGLNLRYGDSVLPPLIDAVSRARDAPFLAVLATFPVLLGWPVLVAACAALAGVLLRRRTCDWILVAWFLMIPMAAARLPEAVPRHLLDAVPLALLLVAVGARDLVDWLSAHTPPLRRRLLEVAAGIAAALLAVSHYLDGLRIVEGYGRYNYVGLREGAAWLRENAGAAPTYIQSTSNRSIRCASTPAASSSATEGISTSSRRRAAPSKPSSRP